MLLEIGSGFGRIPFERNYTYSVCTGIEKSTNPAVRLELFVGAGNEKGDGIPSPFV